MSMVRIRMIFRGVPRSQWVSVVGVGVNGARGDKASLLAWQQLAAGSDEVVPAHDPMLPGVVHDGGVLLGGQGDLRTGFVQGLDDPVVGDCPGQ